MLVLKCWMILNALKLYSHYHVAIRPFHPMLQSHNSSSSSDSSSSLQMLDKQKLLKRPTRQKAHNLRGRLPCIKEMTFYSLFFRPLHSHKMPGKCHTDNRVSREITRGTSRATLSLLDLIKGWYRC